MILVLGGSGQLGTAFRNMLSHADFPSRAEFDLVETARLRRLALHYRPSLIINCAAYTDVDAAETDEDRASAVNADAVGELARVANDLRVPFVTFSTDYVFDGESEEPYVESSPPYPINAYGRSKLAGEELALAYPGTLVVRTSWLFSATHPNFVAAIVRRAAAGQVRVVSDQWGSPTPADDVAAATVAAIDRGVTGVLHLAGSPAVSRHGLARAAVVAAGIEPGRVVPCVTADHPLPARRPRWSVLGSERLAALGLVPLPEWTAGLPRVVEAVLGLRGK